MTIPKAIIDKMFEYERYILMKEHSKMYKYVLQDIEEGLKRILIDHDWHKQYYREIDNVHNLKFIWKQSWTQQPLEGGAALYIGRGRIVCSKQVPGVRDYFYIIAIHIIEPSLMIGENPLVKKPNFLIISIFIVNYSY